MPLPIQTISVSEIPADHESAIPAKYSDLGIAFSKSKSLELQPHRPSDCAIELLPGTTPPKGRIFPLSQSEEEAMKSYIEGELAKGFIRPSTSPASSGFFFVKKRDGSLQPCTDYRALNDITVKFRYPLPLFLQSSNNFVKPNISPNWIPAVHTT